MTDFSIKFDPELPDGPSVSLPLSRSGLEPKIEDYGIGNDVDVRLIINNRSYSYYPTSAWTILNDLHREWELTKQRQDHDILLCEYPVVFVSFINESAVFYELAKGREGHEPTPVGGPVAVARMLAAIEGGIGKVLNFVLQLGSMKDADTP